MEVGTVLQLVDTDSAREADLQSLKAALERRLNEPGLFDERRPVRCWGVNLGTFCPCDEHAAQRDALSLHGVRVVGERRIRQPWEPAMEEDLAA